jgi:sugar phosphate isomerase/epimerase
VETGPEKAVVLREFLDSLGAKGVRVNLDPANLVMCSDDRPENALRWLGKYVVHTHAKDGVMVSKKIAEARAEGRATPEYDALMAKGRTFLEVPLGEGDVNFDVYLPALAATGFDGFLAIEREVGEDPAKDIALAVNFLREKLARCGIPH